jgi:oligosaccharide repeat unit polymerase
VIYILMIFLILQLLLALTYSRGDILSPWVVTCGMFILSTGVVLLNVWKWGTSYHLYSIIIIVSALLFFGLGEFFSKGIIILRGKNSLILKEKLKLYPIKIHNNSVIFISFIMFALLIFDFVATYKLSLQGGNPGGFDLMLKYARYSQGTLGLSKGIIITRLIPLNQAFGYFFTYVYLYNRILFGIRMNKLILLPVIIYAGTAVLSTGRTSFMRILIFAVITAAILFKSKNGWSNKNTSKIVKRATIGLIAFFFIFTFAGRLTGKGLYNTPLEVISYYTGSSILLLDRYLVREAVENEYFGSHTLYGLYNILRGIGFNIPMFKPPLEMEYIPHFYSNLYTSLRRYIQDFNVGGMLFIQFCLGAIYGGAYTRIRMENKMGLSLFIYATLFYPVIESAIEERFLIDVMTFTNLFGVLLMVIVYKSLVKKDEQFETK